MDKQGRRMRGMMSSGLPALLGRLPVRRTLLVLGAKLFLTGCVGANGPIVFRRGEVAPGRYLATVVVKEGGCWPHGLACTYQSSESAEMILPLSLDTPVSVYDIFAHELCHAVAGVRGLVGPADSCHREDGGRLRSAIRRAPD